MSGTKDKIAGLANEAAGHVKQGVGKAIGSEKLQAEGIVQETKGHIQQAVGDAKDAVKAGANKVADAVNKKL
ncbi:CsbD family protein [Methylocella tundrae]|uniref:CsbD family protein n=1 Tax=Methylocella tundrae TaxID=227605 RepID=UPI0030FE6261|nr:CsbD family protein [Methylocella tundrae]